MKRLTTKVTYKVPIGPYCNHDNKKSTPLTRCRFCTDLGKYGFTCVLHNEQLASMGVLINKCDSCMKKQGIVEDVPTVSPKRPDDLCGQRISQVVSGFITSRLSGANSR